MIIKNIILKKMIAKLQQKLPQYLGQKYLSFSIRLLKDFKVRYYIKN